MESDLNPQAIRVTKRERSYGLFQINTKVHKVTKRQALDPEWAAHWVCKHLKYDLKYHKGKYRAIKRYNGCGSQSERYAWKVWQLRKGYLKGKQLIKRNK